MFGLSLYRVLFMCCVYVPMHFVCCWYFQLLPSNQHLLCLNLSGLDEDEEKRYPTEENGNVFVSFQFKTLFSPLDLECVHKCKRNVYERDKNVLLNLWSVRSIDRSIELSLALLAKCFERRKFIYVLTKTETTTEYQSKKWMKKKKKKLKKNFIDTK